MASILAGYEYDIFISYRQKDNKGDHWVTEFVNALKTELESAFKEDISIYFDSNPHDGLLETHNVDKSLEGKLKCLVFIPIISQTYCDPKSFAWQQEFCAFNKLAKEDLLGRDIRLASGNVGSRILPIKIHDIDPSDLALLETELNGVLRAIEFIYREPGVNRPLKPTDNRTDNQSKTDYRNQVNKVANAIKELIGGMQSPKSQVSEKSIRKAADVSVSTRRKLSVGAAVFLALLLAGYLLFTFGGVDKMFFSVPNKSIAVIPFENMNNDPEQDYFSNGIAEDILNHLAKIADLKVKSRTSTLQYKGTTKTVSVIGEELGVGNVVEGSVRRSGNKVRIVVQLIDVQTDTHLWSETYDRDFTDVLSLQSEIAIEIARALEARLTSSERENITRKTSGDVTAYDYFLKAREIVNRYGWGIASDKSGLNSAMSLVDQAISLDKNFGQAFALKGMIWFHRRGFGMSQKTWTDSALYYSSRAIELDPSNPLGYLVRAQTFRYVGRLNEVAIANRQAYEVAPNHPQTQGSYGRQLIFEGDEKGADFIFKSMESQYQSTDPRYYLELGLFYIEAGDVKTAEQLMLKARALDPGFNDIIFSLYQLYEETKEYEKALKVLSDGNQNSLIIIDAFAETYALKKDFPSALKYYERYRKIEGSFDEFGPLRHRLAYVYSEMGRKKEAETLMREQVQIADDIIAGKRDIGGWHSMGALYYDRALSLAYLGKKEEAVASLDSSYRYGWRSNFYFHNDPLLENLLDHPGFQTFMKKADEFFAFKQKAFADALNRAQANKELRSLLEN